MEQDVTLGCGPVLVAGIWGWTGGTRTSCNNLTGYRPGGGARGGERWCDALRHCETVENHLPYNIMITHFSNFQLIVLLAWRY